MGEDEWEIYQTDGVAAWMQDLRRTDLQAAEKVEAAVDVLAEYGPTLVAGDKTGQWHRWYEVAIPQAEQLFALYLKERAEAEEEDRG